MTVDRATGRAVKMQGDPSHPVTRGFLCGKVTKYLDRVYSPDRLLYPMRRKASAPKGPAGYGAVAGREAEAFERITWDEALDEIAARLGKIAAEFGPESVLPYSYAGTIGQLGYGSMDRRFFHRLGASQLDRTICSTAGEAAMVSVYGLKVGTPPEDFAHAGLILVWGGNVHCNNVHLWPFIEEARRKGARLVVIDPYRTRTAALADEHLAIHPGTGPGLPYPARASAALRRAVAAYDASSSSATAIDAVLASADAHSTITLWHLLQRVEPAARGRVFDRLATLAPPPASVTRARALRGESGALQRWRTDLEPAWVIDLPRWRMVWNRLRR